MSGRGVVLTGGGARAAYQVGVLRAIADMFPDTGYPFDVITGTSAGAINAMSLASGGDIFRHNVSNLEHLWSELDMSHVYRSGSVAIMRNMTRVARKILSGGAQSRPLSLLNNSPLREFLEREIDFDAMHAAVSEGKIRAVGVNACGYATGQNVCFFEGDASLESWNAGQRAGSPTQLTLDHVMASSAIPTLFPPVSINREYFGDGVTRQSAHVSPALRLGADRVLVIGVSANRMCSKRRPEQPGIPSFGQVMSHVFNGMFLDTLDYDLERTRVINDLVALIPEKEREAAGLDLRPVDLLEIMPSQPIEEIAAPYMDGLPPVLKPLTGVPEDGDVTGASLASYLLFDRRFSRDLIALGYRDAQDHSKQLERFFAPREA